METADHDSTLEELPFEAIEDYLVRNSARISSETIRLLNIQNNCDKEGETDRAFDLTDVANITQASLPTDFQFLEQFGRIRWTYVAFLVCKLKISTSVVNRNSIENV